MSKKKTQSIKVDESMINEDSMNQFNVGLSVNAIPDIDSMVKTIDNMLDFIESPRMKSLEISNKDRFETEVFTKYNDVLPMKIITLIVDKNRYENLEQLLDMLETLSQIKKGKKDLMEETQKFNEKQNETFVYPKFGGKDNFEQMMKKK